MHFYLETLSFYLSICVCVYVCLCVRVVVRGHSWVSFFKWCLLIYLIVFKGSLWLTDAVRRAGQWAPGIFLSLLPSTGITNSCLPAWLFFFFPMNSEDQTHSLAFAWQVLYQLSCVLARHLISLCNSSVIISRMILCFAKYMLYWLTPRITKKELGSKRFIIASI